MKPSDIIVGKRYVNPSLPGYKFLGVGKSESKSDQLPWDIIFKEKCLVVIEDQEDGYLGGIVKDPEFCVPGYWDGFRLEENNPCISPETPLD
jgi:hypothetical protein